MLVDCVVSAERPASGGHVTKIKESVVDKAANIGEEIAAILYLIEHALTAMMTTGLDNRKLYGDS